MSRRRRAVLREFLQKANASGRVVPTQQALLARIARRDVTRVVTVNLFDLHHYADDPTYRATLDSADAWTADGWPVQRALVAAGVPTDRVTGSQLCLDLVSLPLDAGVQRVAVLGSSVPIVEAFAERLGLRGRQLVYAHCGYRDDWQPDRLPLIFGRGEVDLLLIAVGSPHGARVASRLEPALACPTVSVGAGVGMATGMERRAPRSLQQLGLEWAWRLVTSPRHLGRRYLLECVPMLPPLIAVAREASAAGRRG